jgi:hypothetical protein
MMLEELQRCNYSTITTRNYPLVVADFTSYFGKSPDKLGPNERRTYQASLFGRPQADTRHGGRNFAALRTLMNRQEKQQTAAGSLPEIDLLYGWQ